MTADTATFCPVCVICNDPGPRQPGCPGFQAGLLYVLILRREMVLLEGDTLNSLFQELADWEYQLKALEQDIPIEWEELSP
jgi:hypothetical protein